ncbi:outer membrane assembly protein AsmA [Brenneria rubrifaciens]|uniref:Outer membrane assembly protein AsmA n=1 Tax=Brenneria rubrifaciens TaxID=55213 RepID=A0A4P8QNW3_9GAMM|nr:outer membrane assembly protein AsmA [Brenneria rubrifaciens]QCR08076.1 outer membrane assembly protein AsmA [Brenneria rubrifaciens]
MRRFLTTLAILLVVLVAGMTALVVLVNPNDFRAYMIKQVEDRSGYRLQLDGELRWHVWPQLSILSGGMSLSAPGSTAPVVSAENMRLDVQLLPLLSHKLAVKQVMLKGAVIQLTPASEAKQPGSAPIAPAGSPAPTQGRGWRFDIERLKVADSLLVLQPSNDEQINIRDINLLMEQDDNRQVSITLSSRINRDQRDVAISLSADMDMQHFPQQINAKINTLDYRIQGAGIPESGISGSGSLQASYQQLPEKVTVSQLALSANESQLTGSGSATFGEHPDYVLDLKSGKLDLDALLGMKPGAVKGAPAVQVKASKPVISAETPSSGVQEDLLGFTGRVSLQAETIVYRGLDISQFILQATNQHGVLNIATLSGKLGEGNFSFPGKIDGSASPAITFQPELKNIDIAKLTAAFALPQSLSGTFSLNGQFAGNAFSLPAMIRQWQGKAALKASNLRLQGMNIQQMVQMAVARNNVDVRGQERYERYTEVRQLAGNVQLRAGKLTIDDLNGTSELLALTGSGQVDLIARTCDTHMNVRITDGWQGDKQLVSILQNTAVPLRIYGSWDNLNYQLQVDQLLRKRLQNELKRRLNDWANKNQESQKGKDLKQFLDRL